MSRRGSASVWWDRLAVGRTQTFKAFGRLLQLGIESANAESDQRCFHPVDDPTLLCDQALVLAVGPLGIFVLEYLYLTSGSVIACEPSRAWRWADSAVSRLRSMTLVLSLPKIISARSDDA